MSRKLTEILCVVFLFSACGPGPRGNRSVKFDQYFVQGQQLYLIHCSNCHQKDGKGLGLLYPPLDQSDFMDNHMDEVICIIKHGRSGELIVNGMKYNQPMPGVPSLTDLEIAEIVTYIYNSWSHEKGLVDVNEIGQTMRQCVTID